jgi:archaellum component FlaC
MKPKRNKKGENIMFFSRKILMSSRISLFAILSLSMPLLFLACDRGTDEAEVREKTEEAVEAMQEYAEEKREDYRETVRNRLNNIKTQIQELRERTAGLQREVGSELQTSLDTLNQSYEKLQQDFDGMRDSQKAEWDSIQAELNQALDGLEQAYQDAAAQLQARSQDSEGSVTGYQSGETPQEPAPPRSNE